MCRCLPLVWSKLWTLTCGNARYPANAELPFLSHYQLLNESYPRAAWGEQMVPLALTTFLSAQSEAPSDLRFFSMKESAHGPPQSQTTLTS